jgi:hypothetical protein
VDAKPVPPLPVSARFFRPVSRRTFQIVQTRDRIQQGERSLRDARSRRSPRLAGSPDLRRPLVGESLDHLAMMMFGVNSVDNVGGYYG